MYPMLMAGLKIRVRDMWRVTMHWQQLQISPFCSVSPLQQLTGFMLFYAGRKNARVARESACGSSGVSNKFRGTYSFWDCYIAGFVSWKATAGIWTKKFASRGSGPKRNKSSGRVNRISNQGQPTLRRKVVFLFLLPRKEKHDTLILLPRKQKWKQ